MNRVLPLCLALTCFCEVSLAQKSTQTECQSPKELIRQVWALEGALIHVGDNPAPATFARELSTKAQVLERQLLKCEMAALDAKDQDTKEMLSAERINLQFIESSQIAYGGLGQVPNSELPADLADLAPSCKEVLETRLVERVESEITGNAQKLSGITSKEIMPYFEKSNQLLNCAFEAQRVGYKDVAIRILSAATAITNAVVTADTHEQAPIIHILQSSPIGSSVPIQVGPEHCTATMQDWGWQKSIKWDCY